jgi:hypothetical protein
MREFFYPPLREIENSLLLPNNATIFNFSDWQLPGCPIAKGAGGHFLDDKSGERFFYEETIILGTAAGRQKLRLPLLQKGAALLLELSLRLSDLRGVFSGEQVGAD